MLGGFELGVHSALAHSRFFGADELLHLLDALDQSHDLPIASRIPSTTVSSTSKSARSALATMRGEHVVVAEGDFHQLIGADRVILIDDRNAPSSWVGVDRVAQIQESRSRSSISSRVSRICATGNIEWLKRIRPDVHQPPLPDGGDRLELARSVGRW